MQIAFLLIRCLFCTHAIMLNIWLYSNSIHIFCWFEFWVFYTHFLFSIEISWNDQDFFVCFATEISELVYLYVSFLKLENSLLSRFSYRICEFKESLWSWFSHRNSLIWRNHCNRDFRNNCSFRFLINLR